MSEDNQNSWLGYAWSSVIMIGSENGYRTQRELWLLVDKKGSCGEEMNAGKNAEDGRSRGQ
jgi:hypothetical protein